VDELKVRERVYAIWEGEGRAHGRDLVHWYQAEAAISSPFPESDFRRFVEATIAFFPGLVSDEALCDSSESRRHFDWLWQAVRYRHRICTETCGELKALLAKPSVTWAAGWIDEELNYKVDRCMYIFIMSALSVFESFVFCLYFLGNTLRPKHFPHFDTPKRITLSTTGKSFAAAFPHATITKHLLELPKKAEYKDIGVLRNILAHRLSGRRSTQFLRTTHPDSTYTQTREKFWLVPGLGKSLNLSNALLQQHLDNVTNLLTTLISASRQFAESEVAA
jgi:Protein of unknown function (DUF2934)